MDAFLDTRAWIFDLDNTLYPAQSNLFAQIDQRMGEFISDYLDLPFTDAHALIADGTISDGMIPKIESCIQVLQNGVEAVVIINGKTPHAVLLELFTEHGAGTLLSSAREG